MSGWTFRSLFHVFEIRRNIIVWVMCLKWNSPDGIS